MSDSNTFSEESEAYARARPRYPREFYLWLARQCATRVSAWDCATGNGQAAHGLAAHFVRVHATDISTEQLSQAAQRSNIEYSAASAEAPPFRDASFDLIVVAQALHWFDFARFWPQVLRVARPGAFFCAWGYAWLRACPAVDRALIQPFREILEPYWAPENRLLWDGYRDADIAFPLERSATPKFSLESQWTREQLIEYMCTWSAYKRSRADPATAKSLDRAITAVREQVDAQQVMTVTMPLTVVAGRLA